MAICGVCGKKSILPETYGTLTLCKKCSMKILTSTWRDNVYTTNDEVKEERDSVLRMARRSGFPQKALDALQKYFNDQIIKGLVKMYAGGAGQNIVIFTDHIAIDTQEDFDEEEMEKVYHIMMTPGLRGKGAKEPDPEPAVDGAMIASALGDVLSGLAFGGGIGRSVARAGAGIASGMAARSQQVKGESVAPAANFELRVEYGLRNYSYSDFEDVVLRLPVGEEDYGFIRFQREPEPNYQKDILFFFAKGDGRKKGAREIYEFIQDRVSNIVNERARKKREAEEKAREVKMAKEEMVAQALRSSAQPVGLSAPDELMKWKQLLDVGAISQQEYDAKKAQLLGL